jgi:hypothetical protein
MFKLSQFDTINTIINFDRTIGNGGGNAGGNGDGPGITGPTGPSMGPKGDTGPTGNASTVTGPTGQTGPTGSPSIVTGPIGQTGPTGNASIVTGPTGSPSIVTGPTGQTGPTGNASVVTGPTGSPSIVTGPTGPTGSGSGQNLSQTLAIGNIAGTTGINMNNQNISNTFDLSVNNAITVDSGIANQNTRIDDGTMILNMGVIGGGGNPILQLNQNNAAAGAGSIRFYKNTSSTDVGIGELSFQAKDSGGTQREYGRINATLRNSALTNQDGSFSFQALVNNSLTEIMRINGVDNQIEAFQPIDLNTNGSIISSSGNVNILTTTSSSNGNITIDANGTNAVGDITISAKNNVVISCGSSPDTIDLRGRTTLTNGRDIRFTNISNADTGIAQSQAFTITDGIETGSIAKDRVVITNATNTNTTTILKNTIDLINNDGTTNQGASLGLTGFGSTIVDVATLKQQTFLFNNNASVATIDYVNTIGPTGFLIKSNQSINLTSRFGNTTGTINAIDLGNANVLTIKNGNEVNNLPENRIVMTCNPTTTTNNQIELIVNDDTTPETSYLRLGMNGSSFSLNEGGGAGDGVNVWTIPSGKTSVITLYRSINFTFGSVSSGQAGVYEKSYVNSTASGTFDLTGSRFGTTIFTPTGALTVDISTPMVVGYWWGVCNKSTTNTITIRLNGVSQVVIPVTTNSLLGTTIRVAASSTTTLYLI